MSEFLRLGQVAQALDVSLETLRRWEQQGIVAFDRWQGQRVLRAERLAGLVDTLGRSRRRQANQFTATVVSVETHGLMARVELVRGDLSFAAVLDTETVEGLGLVIGARTAVSVSEIDLDLRPAPSAGHHLRSLESEALDGSVPSTTSRGRVVGSTGAAAGPSRSAGPSHAPR